MTRDEARRLMSSYATGSLSEAERRLLFEAALEDQDLFDELARDRFVLGTPDEAIEQIEERIRRLESNYLIFRLGWPGMEAAKVMRVIELMGQRVLPYFHTKYGRG